MCGGSLNVATGETVCSCEYCGSMQTLPKINDEKKQRMYERAEKYRLNNDFDNAIAVYEQIISEDKTDAESYWSVLLCKYGVVYVERPSDKARIPTINRLQFEPILEDENYLSALRYADPYQKEVYINEAKRISRIQKGILEVSGREEPFDVFICYKESDGGDRTVDSVIAQELYDRLSSRGLKVFFAKITLEDKLGTDFEPYIFAALNSAQVMVVLGTKREYFDATWVKNEWSRYLALIKNGAQKILIPAFKDMNASDMPSEFSHLQAQDLSKIGAIQDLVYGVEKIISRNKRPVASSKNQDFEMDYQTALKLMNTADNSDELLYAAQLFSKLSGYKDSAELSFKCKEMVEEFEASEGIAKKLEKWLKTARALMFLLAIVTMVSITLDFYFTDEEMEIFGSVIAAFFVTALLMSVSFTYINSVLKKVNKRLKVGRANLSSVIMYFTICISIIVLLASTSSDTFTVYAIVGFIATLLANSIGVILRNKVIQNIDDYNRNKKI